MQPAQSPLVVVLMIGYYTGGYVSGRMSRFDGARQGFGVWLIGIVVALLVALTGWIFGNQYDVFDRVDLPSVSLDGDTLTTGGLVLAAAVLLGTLLAAVVGGKAGLRYHHKVDRFVTPDEFKSYETVAYSKGFLMVSSSPLTRSSHHAGDDFARLKAARERKLLP